MNQKMMRIHQTIILSEVVVHTEQDLRVLALALAPALVLAPAPALALVLAPALAPVVAALHLPNHYSQRTMKSVSFLSLLQ
ncbi:hypothetical protein HMPREF3208_00128 [Gardnerella vaginalis]|uniref:Uncharacterized protein n=1 Tax=Gardnerella vaginalis TaxID=2702 RepID=A0A133P2T7_GARVA|nr:hypothetical protein HMPREF3208_00128 [Gardnerella vaginalis]